MNPYLKLMRLSTSFLGTLGVIVGALLAGITSVSLIVLGGLVCFFAAAGGNVINDYFDIRTDKISKPNRPVASGKVAPKSALIFSIALFAVAIVLSTMLHQYAMILAIFNVAVAIVYSWKLKARPLIGNISDSWLAASTFIFGGLLIGYFDVTILSIFLMSFSANTAREVVKDIEDIKGDLRAKMKTLPIVAGIHFAKLISLSFLLVAVFLSLIPYGLGIFGMNYLYAVFIADLVFFASGFVLMANPRKSQQMMKVAMFMGIAAFLVGIYF